MRERSPGWAQLRIWTLPEVALAEQAFPQSVLEARFQQGLQYARAWAQDPERGCALCGGLLNGDASYLAVLMPLDECWGLGTSAAVCLECGKAPREAVQKHMEYAATLMFGPEGGHA